MSFLRPLSRHFKWPAWLCLVMSINGLRGISAEEIPAIEPQVKAVADGLAEWKKSFNSLWIVAAGFDRNELSKQSELFPHDATLDGVSWGHRTSFWYQDPYTLHFSHDWLQAGKTVTRSTGAANRFRYWIATSEDGDAESFTYVHSEPLLRLATPTLHELNEHPLQNACRLAALRGLWWSPGCQWLSERLSNIYGIRYIGMEDVDGHACIVLTNRDEGVGESGMSVNQTWHFDPLKQFLPRRFVITQMSMMGESQDFVQTWQATEFKQVGAATWFPSQGFVERQYKTSSQIEPGKAFYEWVVLELELDKPMPVTLMQPPKITGSPTSFDESLLDHAAFEIPRVETVEMEVQETLKQFRERLQQERREQLGKDSLALLLVIIVLGAVFMSVYAGYRRLSGSDLRSSV